ncbi:MAG TPA: hypothetical protein VK614_01085 [Allosphingosinicella sp.]|nr:hypothetical protein [Allosphingosinicella sp.]
MSTKDPRLERLYDYTKFHIGVYLLAAGAMGTIAGSRELRAFLGGLIHDPIWLAFPIAAMGVAGFAGGLIASTCATAATLDDVWVKRIGPWSFPVMSGRLWARVEHAAFWLSLASFAAAVLLAA